MTLRKQDTIALETLLGSKGLKLGKRVPKGNTSDGKTQADSKMRVLGNILI